MHVSHFSTYQNTSADALLSFFKMAEPVYSNTITRDFSKSAWKKNEDKDAIRILGFSVLLLLSLLANVALAYLNYGNDPDWLMSCEPVTNCSHPDIDHNAQTKPSFHMYMRNWSNAHCPKQNFKEEWVKAKAWYGWYVFTSEKQDWNSSRRRCQDLGGDLAIINNKEEQNVLADHVQTIGQSLYWIGLTDSDTEGLWQWVDGTRPNNEYWAGPPDDHKGVNPLGEDCVVLTKNSGAPWGDVSCLREESSVCEIPCY